MRQTKKNVRLISFSAVRPSGKGGSEGRKSNKVKRLEVNSSAVTQQKKEVQLGPKSVRSEILYCREENRI
jgi:hypothetical protein